MSYESFDAAKHEADKIGGCVGGTIRDGKPVYFLHRREDDDEAIETLAFKARYGRPPNEHERVLGKLMRSIAPPRAAHA